MSEELRPCPFCKSNNTTLDYYEISGPQELGTIVVCNDCGASAKSIVDWNTRPIEDALQARIAELEAEIDQLTVHDATERQDDKWIPVSERLPEMNVRVLIASSGYVSTDFLCVKTYPRFRFEGSVYPVTHWMPLPEPPEVK